MSILEKFWHRSLFPKKDVSSGKAHFIPFALTFGVFACVPNIPCPTVPARLSCGASGTTTSSNVSWPTALIVNATRIVCQYDSVNWREILFKADDLG